MTWGAIWDDSNAYIWDSHALRTVYVQQRTGINMLYFDFKSFKHS